MVFFSFLPWETSDNSVLLLLAVCADLMMARMSACVRAPLKAVRDGPRVRENAVVFATIYGLTLSALSQRFSSLSDCIQIQVNHAFWECFP